MALQLIGKKKGMTHLFDEEGNLIPCTVISIEPNVIAQIKNKDNDGYQAVQIAAEKLPASKAKNLSKALQGHYKKLGVDARRHIMEVRVEDSSAYTVGQEVNVSELEGVKMVDVIGTSIGKGFQGVMKRWNFSGGPAAHGSGFHRHAGSTGMRSTPGRCLPGVKKAGQMGNERVIVEKLKIVKIDKEKNLLIVKGPIPGSRGGRVYVRRSVKAPA